MHNRRLVLIRSLVTNERVAFFTLSNFSLRELLKLGRVCKRFYWLTGNQDLINAAVQRQHEVAAQTIILMGVGASPDRKIAQK